MAVVYGADNLLDEADDGASDGPGVALVLGKG